MSHLRDIKIDCMQKFAHLPRLITTLLDTCGMRAMRRPTQAGRAERLCVFCKTFSAAGLRCALVCAGLAEGMKCLIRVFLRLGIGSEGGCFLEMGDGVGFITELVVDHSKVVFDGWIVGVVFLDALEEIAS
jgi:hypothetical protein